MDHARKMLFIVGSCILVVGIVSGIILFKTLHPAKGLQYERITMEQAEEYMEYEEGYLLVDVRVQMEYDKGHIPGALCIPLEELKKKAGGMLPDKEQMIYVYGETEKHSCQAAKLLCGMDYTNITEIGAMSAWEGSIEY